MDMAMIKSAIYFIFINYHTYLLFGIEKVTDFINEAWSSKRGKMS